VTKTPKSFSEYLRSAPAPSHAGLKTLRALVRRLAPAALETISYKMPTFVRQGAPLVYFAGYAKHVGVYGLSNEARALEVPEKFRVAKGTLRFVLDEPIPVGLLTKLVRLRAKQIALVAKAKTKSMSEDKKPSKAFASYAAWEKWLAANHDKSTAMWVRFAKKTSARKRVNDQAVEVALRFGWIDGQSAGFDEESWLQRYTPRTSKSRWSKINVAKVEKLIAAGRMAPSGLREVERAKADGRWAAAYDPPTTMTEPPDFKRALTLSPTAKKFFATLDATNRHAVLHRLQAEAKKPETRRPRIERMVKILSEGKALHPMRRART